MVKMALNAVASPRGFWRYVASAGAATCSVKADTIVHVLMHKLQQTRQQLTVLCQAPLAM